MEAPERRWFCPCGWSTSKSNRPEKLAAFRRHRLSGEHGTMTKVNALRDGMAAVDAAVEREIEEVE